mmetsp:Transcript_27510/g.49558  ORF Transcript_27510/g.49558 Transcript_27510/m.49558 type:complete len:229 (-) Transcript_27510:848-1534(-)|eukprot:CAMPEP_0204899360 /NCGR_PEP_ID=MMETSP1397-20131031/1809_1 /ASSEMBLY_ACC=CAM_ASM_000891 /TAXON_ID=49980 /ORGANISM="Climacostomum Climacostomum virens, Strain Stock W-24" /LENGTH=228 /DNA_ID=CAMNT_0052067311 /DNA_START=41 /DNA_END=727 /DNA_ORIENTATION=-
MRRLLVVGGNGALGRAVVTSFSSSWEVTSVDFAANDTAQKNIVLSPIVEDLASRASAVRAQLEGKYHTIACFAGGWVGGSIADSGVFAQYEQMLNFNLNSALLTAHLASHHLSEAGLLLFTGAAAAFRDTTPSMIAYGLSKTATHSLALNMATRQDLPQDADVITILPETIDTPSNRAAMPTADYSKWSNPASIAALVKMWSEGSNRPANGSFAVMKVVSGAVVPEFV